MVRTDVAPVGEHVHAGGDGAPDGRHPRGIGRRPEVEHLGVRALDHEHHGGGDAGRGERPERERALDADTAP